MTLEAFQTMLGQTVMYCQVIEHDIKLIYAAMNPGDFEETFFTILREKWTLGQTVKRLEDLDASDGHLYLSRRDYGMLNEIAGMRNHWCHETFIEFIYDQNFLTSEAYRLESLRLELDRNKLAGLYRTIEAVRLQAIKDFGRR